MHYRGNGLPERKPEYRLGVIGICIMRYLLVSSLRGGIDMVYMMNFMMGMTSFMLIITTDFDTDCR